MSYSSPEFIELGSADVLIENGGHKPNSSTDNSSQPSDGDHEIDE